MLTVAKITSVSALGYADYLEGRSETTELGDYYLRDGDRVEAPGRWAGGATAVGMDPAAPVTGAQLRELMAVRRPDTGEPLRQAGATGQVAALDATFSAPKSVSAAWAIADPALRDQIEQAHETAIDQALDHSVAKVAMTRQRVGGEVVHRRAREVIASSWRHTTARAVDGQLPDPQLHSHVLLHGAVREDGRVVAIDSRTWFQHRRELGAAYRTELARGMHDLGFEIQRGTGRAGRYFEIAGIPQQLIDRWSSRHHQVRQAIETQLRDQEHQLEQEARAGGPAGERAAASLQRLREQQQLTPRQDRHAAIATRSAKPELPLTHRDLDQEWQTTARQHSLTPEQLQAARQERVPLAAGDDLRQGLTEFDARFTPRDARAVALEASAGLGITEAIEPLRAMRQSGELVELADGTFTTDQHRAREEQTIQAAQQVAGQRTPPIDPRTVDNEIDRLDQRLAEQGGQMTEEQADAIRLMCSDRRLSVIEGQAGTGKSTVLTATARAHQTDGQRIIVTSTAALAAHRLAADLSSDGVDCHAYSTAGLHAAIQSGRERLGPETTVIHDEAALASTREQRHLFTAIKESRARLIEAGDPAQSQPVGAGGLWTDIHQAAQDQDAHRSLTHNVRALDPADRVNQRLARDGDYEQALHGYDSRGRLHVTATPTDAETSALTQAHTDRQAGRDVLVIAQTSNDHLDELNARAQALRHHDAELTGPGLPVPGRPYDLYAGDRVQIRRTLTTPDGDVKVRNGTTGQVQSVAPGAAGVELDLGDGRPTVLTAEQAARADLRLAYVQHPFPAQGVTSDTAHLIATDQMTREGSYVALTRARQSTTIHAPLLADDRSLTDEQRRDDTIPALAERMSRDEPEVPSIRIPIAHEQQITQQTDATIEPADAARPPRYVTNALGARPDDSGERQALWDTTAKQIHQYRQDNQIPEHDDRVLGPEPPPGQFQDRVEHRRLASTVERAARQLGNVANDRDRDGEAERRRQRDIQGYEP